MSDFLPISKEDIKKYGWEQIDFLFISGDAYVDHPSFNTAVICRVLEANGYKVAILPQPDWRNINSFTALGKPRLGVLISGGNLDSMLCHYTAARKPRTIDNYTPGGVMGKRPDHATAVYSKLIKKIWPDIPVIIGGIEASLRRFAHYDYWENKLMPSILVDSKADLLIYGMGERQIVEIASYLAGGASLEDMHYIRGTTYLTANIDNLDNDAVLLPSYSDIQSDKELFAQAFHQQSQEQDPFNGKIVIQKNANNFVVQNPAQYPLTTKEMDAIYDLPYCREVHPSYLPLGGVPAIEEVQFSIISQRGCFGSCAFCAIHSHQGRIIQARSHESIIKEAQAIIALPSFKGYIHDVGGPTANFRHPSCAKQLTEGVCKDRQCLFPTICPNLDADHTDYINLLRKLRALPGVKKVFIRSGIRYDYLLADKNQIFLDELCRYHISGQLKIAPEHISPKVLKCMGKPSKDTYLKFMKVFNAKNKEIGLKQFVVPYFISSHPGCSLKEAVELAEFLRDTDRHPEQVQDFIPTPGSASTAMYYSGIDPASNKKVYITQNPHTKAMQRALMQYKNPKNRALVKEALEEVGRTDLIGMSDKCLLRSDIGRPNVKQRTKFDVYKGRHPKKKV
ncbi:MAG: YgiQ family radical SAM protein [Acidaminococcaceae bacterium]|nr:YgiQ family radical SAM protein [Acidaminococcaceae bacterium]